MKSGQTGIGYHGMILSHHQEVIKGKKEANSSTDTLLLNERFSDEIMTSDEPNENWSDYSTYLEIFLDERRNHHFTRIHCDWALDEFNLCNLFSVDSDVHDLLHDRLEICLDLLFRERLLKMDQLSEDNVILQACRVLYSRIHARWIRSPGGLFVLKNMIARGYYGICPSTTCDASCLVPTSASCKEESQQLLGFCAQCGTYWELGYSDILSETIEVINADDANKIPKKHGRNSNILFNLHEERFPLFDGEAFGPYLPALFYLEFPEQLHGAPSTSNLLVYGFRIHKSSHLGFMQRYASRRRSRSFIGSKRNPLLEISSRENQIIKLETDDLSKEKD